MRQYIIRRVLLLIPTLLVVYTITFVLMHATPGGPWDPAGEKPLPAEVIAELNKAYGLDRPLYRQYFDYLWKALHGDFGPSYTSRSRSVTDIVRETFPVSIQLGLEGMALALLVGIPLGVIGALKQNTWVDYLATFTSIVGISTPNFVAITVMVLIFALSLHWVPTQGWDGPFGKAAILPAIALALGPAAFMARYTRSSMLDVIRQDYIRTARAKGLRESGVIVRHALKNALIPVTTFAGLALANVITGSFFVEAVYGVPGIGRYFVTSISGRDYPVIIGTILIYATLVAVMNLIVDILYGLIDPRIRYD
ncbi:MAG TPA: ABC transporter permease [Thermomicrobiales bacterium]|nr:ABC transporter permease [Thermomicrobiales bacterium]